jgi:RHS repeat-associated protein
LAELIDASMSTPELPNEIYGDAPMVAAPDPTCDAKRCIWAMRTLEYAARLRGPREAGSKDTWECHDLGLFYTTDGKLWRSRWSHWDENSEGPVGSVTHDAARKFYYSGPRQRYLTQEVDPTTWEVLEEGPGEPTQAFTTYLGDMPWADFTVDADWTPTKVRDYVAGSGLHAQKDTADPPNVEFLHGDLIGSTLLRTDDTGEPVSGFSGITYTAFGEPVYWSGSAWETLDSAARRQGRVGGEFASGQPRYDYGGGWGYESGHYQDPAEGSNLPGFTDLLALYGPNTALAPLTFQHVGFRWYQPGIGRFVQRDPIGTDGDLNVYAYCECEPTSGLDPEGLLSIRPGGPRWNPGARRWIGPDGRFVRPPARYRKVKGVLIYWSAKKLAQMNYWLWGEPWPGDPEDILFDIGKNVCILWARSFDEPPPPPPPGYVPRWGPGYGCFVEGTPVSTPEGAVSVEAVAQGSAVWGLSNGSVESARVESVHTHATTVLVTLILPSEVIRCTPEHPFWVVDRGWTRAGDLRAGDLLCNQDEECVPVDAVTVDAAPGPMRVFNLTVAGGHTFYVGHSSVLVHNKQ